ncbi:MAG TPA: molybdenum cofactor guanylyltransferase [Sphingomicrobium sp.]|nr:molybdenum cofactor guanylyltransferase [Sphingomicrobium sp.]
MQLKLLGAVIAGGQSRRFGSDKALAEVGGRCLLEHVIAGLSAQTDFVVICGREVSGHTCFADHPEPGLGPLGGLAAALHVAAMQGFHAVLTSACDTPDVPADLAEALAGQSPAVITGQPLFGFWPAALSVELDAYLAAGQSRAVSHWADWAGARRVRLIGEIANINTPADLTALRFRRLLGA